MPIIVEWTNGCEPHTSLFQSSSILAGEFAKYIFDHLLDLRRFLNLVDDAFRNLCHNRGKNFISIKGTGFIINEGTSFITIKGWTAYIVKPNVRVARVRVP